ncbi:hypothetical protein PGB90_005266 [Kerria lacca]
MNILQCHLQVKGLGNTNLMLFVSFMGVQIARSEYGLYQLPKPSDAAVQVNTIADTFIFHKKLLDFIDTDLKMSASTGLSLCKFDKLCASVEFLLMSLKPSFAAKSEICIRQRMLLTLMKLKLNIRFPFLSAYFDIKIPVQAFQFVKCTSRTYSRYKSNHTLKIMIEISSSRLISFVIKCGEAGIELIQPPFLEKNKHLTADANDRNRKIVRARVHVERVMQRLKMYEFCQSKISYVFLN